MHENQMRQVAFHSSSSVFVIDVCVLNVGQCNFSLNLQCVDFDPKLSIIVDYMS